jgi:sodium/hydrogen antiporter
MTVGLSVLAHGVTAAPLATRYANWLDAQPATSRSALESAGESDIRWRLEHEVKKQ